MIEAMCLYEVDLNEDPDPKYARSETFNGSVSVDIDDHRRWIVYVQSDPPIAEGSPEAELLKQAIVLFATRPERPELARGAEPVPYRPRFHGFHLHDPVDPADPNSNCTDGSHHPSCMQQFGPAPETSCVKSGARFGCTHED